MARACESNKIKEENVENVNNKIDEQKAVEQNENTTEQSAAVEDDELTQEFLNMRRSIQRIHHRRDAWTRRWW